MQKQLKHKSTIHYVNFGSGQLLQDLILLSKVLEKRPTAHIQISLIDNGYGPIKFAHKNPNDLEHWNLKESSIKKYKEWAQANTPATVYSDAPAEEITYNFQADLFCYTKAQETIKKILQQNYPKAQITLRLFYSTEEFYAWLKDKNVGYPDFITSADALHYSQETKEEYSILCKNALKNNPTAQNIALYTEIAKRLKLKKFVS